MIQLLILSAWTNYARNWSHSIQIVVKWILIISRANWIWPQSKFMKLEQPHWIVQSCWLSVRSIIITYAIQQCKIHKQLQMPISNANAFLIWFVSFIILVPYLVDFFCLLLKDATSVCREWIIRNKCNSLRSGSKAVHEAF